MIHLIRKITGPAEPGATLTLPLEQRIRSRLRVTLDDGTEAGLFLDRGTALHDGDLLAGEDGFVVLVRAAPETCSTVTCDDPLILARAAYHLGNRHVPLQIEGGLLRYPHDHVLDDMLRGLGLQPAFTQAPFEPESGAYGGAAHSHSHGHHGDHAH